MPTSNVLRSVARLLLRTVLVTAVLGGCSTAAGDAASPPPTETGATRTIVELHLGDEVPMTTEIVRLGDDVHGTARSSAGVLGEEIRVGDDDFVRLTGAELVLGANRWIHTDLSQPAERRFHDRNPAGIIEMASIADLTVGGRFGALAVTAVRHPAAGVTLVELGQDRRIRVTTEVAADVTAIRRPDPSQVVALGDLPALVGAR